MMPKFGDGRGKVSDKERRRKGRLPIGSCGWWCKHFISAMKLLWQLR